MNKPDMLEHAFNPSIPESGTADLSEFKAILALKTYLFSASGTCKILCVHHCTIPQVPFEHPGRVSSLAAGRGSSGGWGRGSGSGGGDKGGRRSNLPGPRS